MDKKKKAAIVVACILVVLLIVLLLLLNKKYTITFDSNGGTEVESQTVKRNNLVVKPEDPSKEGFVFLGWYTEDNEKFDFENTKIKANLTLIAKWGAGNTTRLRIEADRRSVVIDDEITLTLKADGISVDNSKVKWTSSNEGVATVDKDGKVKAIKAGTVIITAEYDGQKAEFTVTVKEKGEGSTTPNTNTTTSTTSGRNNTTPATNTATNTNTGSEDNTNTNTTSGEDNPATTVTYDYLWEKIEESSAEEYRLYIVSSEGNKVSGTVTITTKSGKTYTDSIPATGKLFIKSAVTSVSNVQAN